VQSLVGVSSGRFRIGLRCTVLAKPLTAPGDLALQDAVAVARVKAWRQSHMGRPGWASTATA
jgi:hypothetical protein